MYCRSGEKEIIYNAQKINIKKFLSEKRKKSRVKYKKQYL